ncbi:hypothetical protein AVEN_25169-1 [Araneus ventricosus]|uniref:Reverse transcriptase zinc-binding domain-containing protein n=1 Tax=Araneus ventricosus TaxID=182803 RepID=A0A4Y2WZ57_ARAVE|nr:hypothetical protein AVEN_25169-1 [Araneus ventricosus]
MNVPTSWQRWPRQRKDHVDFSFCPSRIQIKISTRREILEARQQRWSGSSNARWTYLLLRKVDYKRMFGDFFLNQVFTSHDVFPYYQARPSRKHAQCPCRRFDGSIFHVLFECQKLAHLRQSWALNWQRKELKDLLKIEFFGHAFSDIVKELFIVAFPL